MNIWESYKQFHTDRGFILSTLSYVGGAEALYGMYHYATLATLPTPDNASLENFLIGNAVFWIAQYSLRRKKVAAFAPISKTLDAEVKYD